MNERQSVPVSFEHVGEEELDTTVADTHGSSGPFVDVSSVQEIVLKFIFIDFVRGFAVKINEHAN
jgi:hypothetical protein